MCIRDRVKRTASIDDSAYAMQQLNQKWIVAPVCFRPKPYRNWNSLRHETHPFHIRFGSAMYDSTGSLLVGVFHDAPSSSRASVLGHVMAAAAKADKFDEKQGLLGNIKEDDLRDEPDEEDGDADGTGAEGEDAAGAEGGDGEVLNRKGKGKP
eukprot:7860708-Pyramimonas_sp.AAC.1